MSKSNAERELTNHSNELTVDELEHVSGGERKGGNQNRPIEYLKVTMSDIPVTSYQ